MKKPKLIKRLDSGWIHIRFHRECFAQIPPNFNQDIIPDEFIFHPNSNREIVNDYWNGVVRESTQ